MKKTMHIDEGKLKREAAGFGVRALLVALAGLAIALQLTGCATKGGTIALNIGTSRTSAIAGETRDTQGVGVEGSGGVNTQLPLEAGALADDASEGHAVPDIKPTAVSTNAVPEVLTSDL